MHISKKYIETVILATVTLTTVIFSQIDGIRANYRPVSLLTGDGTFTGRSGSESLNDIMLQDNGLSDFRVIPDDDNHSDHNYMEITIPIDSSFEIASDNHRAIVKNGRIISSDFTNRLETLTPNNIENESPTEGSGTMSVLIPVKEGKTTKYAFKYKGSGTNSIRINPSGTGIFADAYFDNAGEIEITNDGNTFHFTSKDKNGSRIFFSLTANDNFGLISIIDSIDILESAVSDLEFTKCNDGLEIVGDDLSEAGINVQLRVGSDYYKQRLCRGKDISRDIRKLKITGDKTKKYFLVRTDDDKDGIYEKTIKKCRIPEEMLEKYRDKLTEKMKEIRKNRRKKDRMRTRQN